MPVQVVVDALEAVPEPLRSFYVPSDDGKFRLDGVDDAGVLKRSLENARRERAEAKAALDKYKDFDPDEYTKLKQEREEREVQSATKKGEYEKLTQQMVDKNNAELAKRDDQIKHLRSALDSQLIDSEAIRAIVAAKGEPDLLLLHIRSETRVVDEDGKYVVQVVDKDGNPRIGDANGTPMTIAQLVAEKRQSPIFGRAFEGIGASGSGASSGRSAPAGQDLSKLPPVERMNAARALQRK